MKIEFFHNSVCAYCYIQSRRLQELLTEFPDAEVIHRTFPLNYQSGEAKEITTEDEKQELVSMWQRANRVDEAKCFNIEGLEEVSNFIRPASRLPELAIKAAVRVAGEGIQWALSDAIQKAYFEGLQDISDQSVLEEIVQGFDIDIDKWRSAFEDPELEESALADFSKAEAYGLDLIPAIVVNGETLIKGALRPQIIKDKLNTLK